MLETPSPWSASSRRAVRSCSSSRSRTLTSQALRSSMYLSPSRDATSHCSWKSGEISSENPESVHMPASVGVESAFSRSRDRKGHAGGRQQPAGNFPPPRNHPPAPPRPRPPRRRELDLARRNPALGGVAAAPRSPQRAESRPSPPFPRESACQEVSQ